MKSRPILLCAVLVTSAAMLPGCMDMFDPTGGAYARGRFTSSDAFVLRETVVEGGKHIFRFRAVKPAAGPKLRSVSLIALTSGPKDRRIPFTLTPAGDLEFAVSEADFQAYGAVNLWGDYAQPAVAVAGARSVEILQTVRFPGK